ncbi:hypothetical protein V495_00317 [Pseudogymnoascus sp. VKM F-4514 (FW-929)]|nr:hypothetical protein V495_00317 [Pseudogymnoascus sp. VKM F-4514 (FW-929)]KFY66818.1 hypothetical protein V497_00679 [Pseudogymnoascus sp. VKM F-4516 (FW-969)]
MATDTESIPGYAIHRAPADANCCSSTPSTSTSKPHHPLDQLTVTEIPVVTKLIRDHASPQKVKFNSITLREPPKKEYAAFRSSGGPRPDRKAFALVLEIGTANVAEVIVNVTHNSVESWKQLKDAMPTLTLEDLDFTEILTRNDPRVIEACREIGITDMSNIYVDAWSIGHEERWGFSTRLQQGLAYYRSSEHDNQYAHPLDFSVVVDTEKKEILSVDIRRVNGERTTVPLDEHNYLPEFISESYKPERIKPINVTQPEGVSFTMDGNELSWCGFSMHVSFNYREGIVLSDVRVDDPYEKRERTLFNRISMVEMVVPYGCPEPPHHRKHAFDVGEYGSGFMTNSLKLGCDCKGAIHYLDGVVAISSGEAAVIKNAICIHEEDNGLLYKHTDFRDGSVISARDRKLVISQIITAANYEYGFYHIFHLDGTYQVEMKLTGMLNTYPLHPSEEAAPYGTEVAKRVTAHNHQHIFSLRIDAEIDGPSNTVIQSDAVAADDEVGSPGNYYGNAFYCKKTPLRTSKEGAAQYCHETSRTWDIVNPNVLHPVAKKPVSYKIVSRESAPLLAKPGSVVWKRAGFARKTLWVTPYRDYELFPAGDYVPQSQGTDGHPHNGTIVDWVERDEPIENTDIVCYLQFGITHFPRTEDFPIMPAEPVSIMLRASNFFLKNPALWVPPTRVNVDKLSTLAFPDLKISENSC